MSYTKHTWSNDETITAAKLNNLEEGVAASGSGALILTSSLVNGDETLDHTMQEIYDAFTSGKPVYYAYSYGVLLESYTAETRLNPVTDIYSYADTILRLVVSSRMLNEGVGAIGYLALPGIAIFQADNMNDYPRFYLKVYVKSDSCYTA